MTIQCIVIMPKIIAEFIARMVTSYFFFAVFDIFLPEFVA
jgi:hypothetical protein